MTRQLRFFQSEACGLPQGSRTASTKLEPLSLSCRSQGAPFAELESPLAKSFRLSGPIQRKTLFRLQGVILESSAWKTGSAVFGFLAQCAGGYAPRRHRAPLLPPFSAIPHSRNSLVKLSSPRGDVSFFLRCRRPRWFDRGL